MILTGYIPAIGRWLSILLFSLSFADSGRMQVLAARWHWAAGGGVHSSSDYAGEIHSEASPVVGKMVSSSYSLRGGSLEVVPVFVPRLYWSEPGALRYGSALGDAQLNASTDVPGSFEYSLSAGTLPPAGIQMLRVTFVPQDSANYGSVTTTTTFTVQPKPLEGYFSAADKVYDGSTTASVTGRTLVGIVGVDDVQLTSGAAQFASKDRGTGKAVSLSGATLSGAKAANYVLSTVNPTTASITPRTVTVTGLAASGRGYNGLRSVVVSGTAALVGAVPGDAVSLVGSPGGLLESAGAAAGKTVEVTGLSLAGESAGNYALQSPTLSAEITKAPLTVKAEDRSKVYDGTAYGGSYGVTYSDLVNGEASGVLGGVLAFSGSALAAVNAGPYAIVPSGLSSANYEITFVAGQLGIARRPLSITANSDAKVFGATKTYGAGSLAFTSAGLASGESIGSVTITAAGGTAAADPAGSYTLIPSAATGGTFLPANYDITYANGTLVVGAGAQSITFPPLADKVFGDPVFALGATASSGLPVTFVVVSGPATLSGGTLGITGTGTVTIRASQAGDANYAPAPEVTRSFNVAKATPVVTWTPPAAIPYGTGLTTAQLNATANVPGSFSYSPASGTVLSAGPQLLTVTFTPEDTLNYAVASGSVSLGVQRKPLTGTITVASKVYDGTVTATITSRRLEGIVGADDVQWTGGTAQFVSGGRGPEIAVSLVGSTLAGPQAGNYVLGGINPATAAITARPALVSGLAPVPRAYTGLRSIGLAGTPVLSGLVAGDEVALSGTPVGLLNSADAGGDKVVTVSGLSLVGSAAGNYELLVPSLAVQVTKAPLVARAEDKVRVKATENPPLTISYRGFVNGEGRERIVEPVISTAAGVLSPPGTYPILLSGGSAQNYDLSLENGTLVILESAAPLFTTQPQATAVAAPGASVTLRAVATGVPPPSFQWYFNGAPLPGATEASLTLPNLQPAGAGRYWVVAANAAGETRSNPAAVEIRRPEVVASHAIVGSGYRAGRTLTVENRLDYSGAASALSWTILLPAGWTLGSSSAGGVALAPKVGAGLVEWSWPAVPPSPFPFSYTLQVPASATGPAELVALVGVRLGDALQFLAQPDPLVVQPLLSHSADLDANFRIGLLELTRVIELYNTRHAGGRTGAYAVSAVETEDGFAGDATRPTSAVVSLTRYHSADTNRDGRIGLLELTRVIELYNYRSAGSRTGQYKLRAGTEDGFDPGP